MKQIRIILLMVLILAIALTSLTSCDVLEQLGITLPGQTEEPNENPDTDNGDEQVDPSTCGHYVTTTVNKVAATCANEGYTGDKECCACGTVVATGKAIDKLEHSYKDGVCPESFSLRSDLHRFESSFHLLLNKKHPTVEQGC